MRQHLVCSVEMMVPEFEVQQCCFVSRVTLAHLCCAGHHTIRKHTCTHVDTICHTIILGEVQRLVGLTNCEQKPL